MQTFIRTRAGLGSGRTPDRQRGCRQPAVQGHLGSSNTKRQGLLSVTRAYLLLPLLLKPDFPAARIEPERLSYLPLAAAELQRTYHMQARARGGRSRSSSSSRCVREAPAAPTTPRNSPESQHSVPGSMRAVAGVDLRAGMRVKLGQCAQHRGLSQAVANLGLLFGAGFRIALSLSGHLRIAEHPGPFNLVLRLRLIVWVPRLREQCNKLPNASVGNLRDSHNFSDVYAAAKQEHGAGGCRCGGRTAALAQPGNMQDSAVSHLQLLSQLCTLGARFLIGVSFSRAGRASKSSSSLGGRPVLWLEMPAFSSLSCSSFAAKAGFLQIATGVAGQQVDLAGSGLPHMLATIW